MKASVTDVTSYYGDTKTRLIYNGCSVAGLNVKVIISFPKDEEHVITNETTRRVVTRLTQTSIFNGGAEVFENMRCVFIYTQGSSRVYGVGNSVKFLYSNKPGEKKYMKVERK